MTLKQSRYDNFYGVLLDDTQFAEIVTYRRPGNPDRPIYCVVNKSRKLEQNQRSEERVDLINVRIGRDESNQKGGVCDPRIGDVIIRQGDSRPYSFQGEILDATPHSWTLEFGRRMPEQVGGRR